MILEDDYGIFLSTDTVLALIPLFILLFTVGNINMDYTGSFEEKHIFYHAQDSMELMAKSDGLDNHSILEEVSIAISDNRIDKAKEIADPFLKKINGNLKYRLVEMNHLNGNQICSNGDFKNSKDVAVAVKCHGDFVYKLYLSR
jgi:hypothetical protein